MSAVKDDGPWKRWGRWVVLAACVLAGAGVVATGDRWQARPAIGALVGAINVLVFVHLYGIGLWFVLRLTGRRATWPYRRAAYSPAVLGSVLLLIALGAVLNSGRDPVGKRLIGASAELSTADREHLRARWLLGLRLVTSTTRVLNDYRSGWLSHAAWLESSRPRLAQARSALAGLRAHAQSMTDDQVRAELTRWDDAGAGALAALQQLHDTVAAGRAGVLRAERLSEDRMTAFARVSDRLGALSEPYLTPQHRELDAATEEIIRGSN